MNLFLSLGHGFKALKAQLRCSWTSAGRWGRRAWPRSSRARPKRSWAPASRWAAWWMARSPAPCNRPSMKTSGSCPLSEPNLDKFKSRRFAEKNAESVLGEGYKVEGLGRSWGVWTVQMTVSETNTSGIPKIRRYVAALAQRLQGTCRFHRAFSRLAALTWPWGWPWGWSDRWVLKLI